MDRSRSLPKGEAFDRAYREGTVVNGPLLVVRWRANDLGRTRWGFAVGKRLEKRASHRNVVRRRLREAARQLPVREGYDVVVTARGRALGATFAELRAGLERGLRKAGLLEEIA
jgi:ribonuclease P protein component